MWPRTLRGCQALVTPQLPQQPDGVPGRHKLTEWKDGSTVLWDCEKDPDKLTSVAPQAGYAQSAACIATTRAERSCRRSPSAAGPTLTAPPIRSSTSAR
jgi:hypothetical protein